MNVNPFEYILFMTIHFGQTLIEQSWVRRNECGWSWDRADRSQKWTGKSLWTILGANSRRSSVKLKALCNFDPLGGSLWT